MNKNKNTGFSETLILPKIQYTNIQPNTKVCSIIQEQVTNNRRKSNKYIIQSQFPKLL